MLSTPHLATLVIASLSIALPLTTSSVVTERATSPTGQKLGAETDSGSRDQGRTTVKGTLDALYEAFSFQPGEAFSTELLSLFFLPQAIFVQPTTPGQTRTIDDLDKFFADFEIFVNSESIQERGIYEDILKTHIQSFGDIAHAMVTFQPRHAEPSDLPKARGVDSFQLVEIDGEWWVVSMTTKFENKQQPLVSPFVDSK
ncbi:MAG: hypothetical protein ACI8TQ_003025 [Planctomycetota bacterium]|jgi:hypothetical protein